MNLDQEQKFCLRKFLVNLKRKSFRLRVLNAFILAMKNLAEAFCASIDLYLMVIVCYCTKSLLLLLYLQILATALNKKRSYIEEPAVKT
ncbi:hypothetical protein ATE84_1095 [Aquimarina sp. MAR_2010_214]|nr:hypothetical protein ATE84_1095 [Aquimarina sp. MAR_2010_214]